MGLITQQTTATTGQTITAAIWNNEFSNIINEFNGGIDNANIDANAAIAYSKLNLTGNIVNADIDASAAIDYSKLDLTGAIESTDLNFTPVTLTGTQTLANKTLTKPSLDGLILNRDDATGSGGTVTLDCSESSHFLVTLNSNSTLAVSNLSENQPFLVHIKQGTGGSKLVSWFNDIIWAGGSTPTLTTTEGKVDSFGFVKVGSDIYGYIVGQNI